MDVRCPQEFRLFPTLRGYRRQWLGRDLLAGVTFGAVTMPGRLATAHLAGMPPITGLYGFLVATVVGAAISTNRHLAFGVDSTGLPATDRKARTWPGPSVSISSARQATGSSPIDSARPRTRLA